MKINKITFYNYKAFYLASEDEKYEINIPDEKHYLPSNGYILTASDIDIKYILGVLNSSLMQFYFRFVGIMTAGGAYTLKHQTINELPLKIPNKDEEKKYKHLGRPNFINKER